MKPLVRHWVHVYSVKVMNVALGSVICRVVCAQVVALAVAVSVTVEVPVTVLSVTVVVMVARRTICQLSFFKGKRRNVSTIEKAAVYLLVGTIVDVDVPVTERVT